MSTKSFREVMEEQAGEKLSFRVEGEKPPCEVIFAKGSSAPATAPATVSKPGEALLWQQASSLASLEEKI
jgi:hypothetical protein